MGEGKGKENEEGGRKTEKQRKTTGVVGRDRDDPY